MTTTTSRADVTTDRAARYGKQLVSHMTRKATGEWDEDATRGHLVLGVARVEIVGHPDRLSFEATAPSDELARIEHVVGIHLARFGARDSLVVSWTRDDGTPGTTQVAPQDD